MTREERTALRAQRLKEELEAKSRELANVQAQQRAAERVRRAKRRQRVGTLADDAGLFLWEDATLAGLFQVLARLQDTTDPVAVLDSLLADLRTRSDVVLSGDGAIGTCLRQAHPKPGPAHTEQPHAASAFPTNGL